MKENMKRVASSLLQSCEYDPYRIMREIDKYGYILKREKYGNYSILTGYDEGKRIFYEVKSPWGRSFTKWGMILGINHLGFRTVHTVRWKDVSYFTMSIEPFTLFQKFFLEKFKGIKYALH